MKKTQPKRMTAVEIIDDVVKFYGKDPVNRRSADNFKCMYNHTDGKRHCAVGRYFTLEYKSDPVFDSFDSVFGLNNRYGSIDKLLIEKVRGHDMILWQDLQMLHDEALYWDENNGGLSKDGTKFVAKLKDKHGKKKN
mgnify:CR=1 FL=1